jgi:asparagine synthase (glutamine-hydrolysing)
MCGIAGKIFNQSDRPADPEVVERMCQAILHRGPDEGGVVAKGPAALGMRRLQVIDIGGGSQPMCNEDGTVWIVFNGEIYNYRKLRQRLQESGHQFKSASDTETILHLYEEMGADCVDELNGMFAFAIWDQRRDSLLLARDRLGKKPLYYAQTPEGLSFASELGALMLDGSISRQLDPVAIDEYLNYLFVPHPRTVYRQARKLPPATVAVFADGKLTTRRYWQVNYSTTEKVPDEEAAVDHLQELLEVAVRRRLEADVPLGAFLSGGLDSSLVVALMRRVGGQQVKTFSIGFSEADFNETDYAREVAQALGTEHREHIVDFQIEALLPTLLRHCGEPFADSSAIPLYHLSRLTRGEVTVALSGDGGDEVFGGYRRYQAGMLAGYFNQPLAAPLRHSAAFLGRHMGEPATYFGHSRRKKIKRFLEFSEAVRQDPSTSWAFFLPKRKKVLSTRKNLPIFLRRKRRLPAMRLIGTGCQLPANRG